MSDTAAVAETDDFQVEEHHQPAPVVDRTSGAPAAPVHPVGDDTSASGEDAAAGETETDTEEATEQTADADASEAGKKLAARKKGIADLQKRVHALTAREKAAIEENARLKQELEQFRGGKSATTPPTKDANADAEDPEPTSDDPKFASYDDFVKAHSKWAGRQAAREEFRAERARIERESADLANRNALERLYKLGREKHGDFDAVIDAYEADGATWSPLMGDVLLHHPLGHELAYALAQDAEQASKLNRITHPIALGMEIGKLLTRLEAGTTATASAAPSVTKAKPPIKPVSSSPVASASDDLSDDLDVDTHIDRMNARERKARRA